MSPNNPEMSPPIIPTNEEIVRAYRNFNQSDNDRDSHDDEVVLASIGLDAYKDENSSKRELNLGDLSMFDNFMKDNEELLSSEEGTELMGVISGVYGNMKSELETLPEGELKEALKQDFENLTNLIKQKNFANKITSFKDK